jgi:Sulfotransferase domain
MIYSRRVAAFRGPSLPLAPIAHALAAPGRTWLTVSCAARAVTGWPGVLLAMAAGVAVCTAAPLAEAVLLRRRRRGGAFEVIPAAWKGRGRRGSRRRRSRHEPGAGEGRQAGPVPVAPSTRALRILPDFLIIGTQKGGTTSLYSHLIRHPQVLRASTKEVHFFDEHFDRGEGWYRGHFPTEAHCALVRRLHGSALTGEASTCYLYHPASPPRVAQMLPRARLLVLLRDPVERVYSHYLHRRREGRETRDFAAVDDEMGMHARGELLPEGTEPGWSRCAYKFHSVLTRGLYLEQLLRWEAHYPPEQLLVLCSEDFSRDPMI